MAFEISRIDRLYRDYTVAAAEKDGTPIDLDGVDAAIITPGYGPTSATEWSPATKVPDRYLLQGGDGTQTGVHTTFGAALTAWGTAPTGSQIATEWTVLITGPDADDTNALAVPDGGAWLWLRVSDTPEIDAEKIERINVR